MWWLVLLGVVASYMQAFAFIELLYYCITFQIKTLLKKYIGCKETIIVVVVPCNVDIATTEALKMAQEVDPTGERTLGEKFFKIEV